MGFNKNLIYSLVIMKMRGLSLVAKFLLTLFIARYMDLASLGVYGLVVGVSTVLPVILGFGIINNFARDAVTRSKDVVTDTLVVYTRCLGLCYLLLAVMSIIGGGITGQTGLAVAIVLVTALEHANNDLFVLLNSLNKPIAANISFFIRSGLWIYGYTILAFFIPSLRTMQTMLMAWILGGLGALVYFGFVAKEWPWSRQSLHKPCLAWLKAELVRAKILYVNDIANTVSQYLDRYVISALLGLELTGVYVLFWSIGNALGNLVRTGTVALFRPSLISAFSTDIDLYNKTFKSCVKQTVIVSVLLSMAAYGGLYFAVPYLKQPLAQEHFLVYLVVLAGFVGRMIYEVLGVAFYSQHQDRKTFVTGLYVLAASALLPIPLISLWGLMGAGCAVLFTVVIGSVVRYVTLNEGRAHG